MTLDETISFGQAGHITDHDVLHEFHNDYLTDQNNIQYVTIIGDDTDDGLTWQTAKASVAGAQDVGSSIAKIYVGPGDYDIKTTIEMQDGQSIIGVSTHTTLGTVLRAHADLGTGPVLDNTSGNLTSGGLFWLQLRGTGDLLGGVGFRSGGNIADNWTMDHVQANGFTSHGFHWDTPGGQTAGNPVTIGVVNSFQCGVDGVGDGFRLETPGSARVSFDYLGGDNNGGTLLTIDNFGADAMVQIHNLKAERTIDGTHDIVVNVLNSNQGMLWIGGFFVFHNVSGGSNPETLIKTNAIQFRYQVDHLHISEPGTNKYVNGFTDGTTVTPIADWELQSHYHNYVWGMRDGRKFWMSGLFPEGRLRL